MQDYDKAIQCFQEVIKLEPGNRSALQQIQDCRQSIHQNLEREKNLYAKMFKPHQKVSKSLMEMERQLDR